MTTLVLEELKTTLVQEFDWEPNLPAHVKAVRPHLYVHNAPAGTFTLSILTSADVVKASKSFTAQDVYDSIETANLYAQVYFPVIFDDKIHLPKDGYKLRLSASGYSFSESSYMAWVRDHENLKVPLTYVPIDDLNNPLSYENWVYA